MMTGVALRQSVTPQLRDFVRPHDARIAQLSGQHFGEGYLDGLLNDTGAVLDSGPPITAVLAAQSLVSDPARAGAVGLTALAQIQHAHYVEGRQVASPAVLLELASEMSSGYAGIRGSV